MTLQTATTTYRSLNERRATCDQAPTNKATKTGDQEPPKTTSAEAKPKTKPKAKPKAKAKALATETAVRTAKDLNRSE